MSLFDAINSGDLEDALAYISGAKSSWSIGTLFCRSLVDIQDWNVDSPLHTAIRSYPKYPEASEKILNALFEARANKYIVNNAGHTPMSLA